MHCSGSLQYVTFVVLLALLLPPVGYSITVLLAVVVKGNMLQEVLTLQSSSQFWQRSRSASAATLCMQLARWARTASASCACAAQTSTA
jgi:hypothetical protein